MGRAPRRRARRRRDDDHRPARRLAQPKITIVDPATGEQVTRASGAERWARLLPFAYREGDLNVEVTEVVEAQPAGASAYGTAPR